MIQSAAPARYIAADTAEDFERERLGLLSRLMNPMTFRRLERLGVTEGWRCLEVGAGDGSVAAWLAARVGERGHVVATDLTPRFLGAAGGIEVRRHDILRDDLETGCYDLVHCRALLMHLPEPEAALRRMAAALRPGGCLLVEEGDLGTFAAADPAHPASAWFDRIHGAMAEHMAALGFVDLYFGRRCRGLLTRVGLAEVAEETATWLCRGGDVGARFQQMNLELPFGLSCTGEVTSEEERRALHDLYSDPSFSFVLMAMVGAWGRRPLAAAASGGLSG